MVYLYSQDGKVVVPFNDREVEFYDNTVTGNHEIYYGSKLVGVYDSEEDCLLVIEYMTKTIAQGNLVFRFPRKSFVDTLR